MKLTLTFASALFLAVLAQSLAECETSDCTQWSSDVLQKCNSQLTNGNIDPDLIACLCSNNLVPNDCLNCLSEQQVTCSSTAPGSPTSTSTINSTTWTNKATNSTIGNNGAKARYPWKLTGAGAAIVVFAI